MSAREWNTAVKRWPGWLALVFVVAGFLAVGAFRSTGPETPADRVDAIASRVACPICDGESVFVSQNNASRAIRSQIAVLVAENDLDDDDIIARIETRYGAEVLLVPRSSGFDALIWVLPAVGFVCGVAGLAVVFRRWKREAAAMAEPTDADRELVAEAMAAPGDRAE
ncbi:MAG: cytochrome c-type biogenesis protein CcmH [Ilumatobacteraceae bacterium]